MIIKKEEKKSFGNLSVWTETIRIYFPKNKFTKGVLLITFGTIVGQLIVLLSSPLITRLYTPSDFGGLAVYASFLGVSSTIGSLRYDQAIPLPKSDLVAANTLGLALIISLSVSVLLGLLLWLGGGDSLVRLTKTPFLRPYLWLLPIGTLGACIYTIFNYWAIRNNEYKKIGYTKCTQGSMLAFTQISLGFLKIQSLGLLLGVLVGHLAGFSVLASSAWRNGKQYVNKISVSGMLQTAKQYRRFPLIASHSSLLDSIAIQAPAFLLAAIYGPIIAGFYALSERVISAPISLVGRSVNQAFTGESSHLILTGSCGKPLLHFYLKTAKQLLIVGLVFAIPLCFLSPFLFATVFGADWLEAGKYAQIMTPMFLAQFIVNPISPMLNIVERQDAHFFWVCILFISTFCAFGVVYYLNLSSFIAITLFSITITVCYFLHFVISICVLKNLD